jgi:hypothetical protein
MKESNVARKILHPALEGVLRKYDAMNEARFREIKSELGDKAPAGMGFLTIVATDAKTGEILDIKNGENMVVITGRCGLAHLLAGSSVPNYVVVAMQFGTGTGIPTVNDTGVFGSIIAMAGGAQSKPVVVDFPDGDTGLKVRFTATVNSDEGNGGSGTQVYQEAVLLMGNGNIFSHKVTGVITKDNTVVLTAAWTYIF